MKKLALFLVLLTGIPFLAMAQEIEQQPEPKGPVQIPDAPQLPYHFGIRPIAPNGEKFGNVAAVAFTPQGHLLVYNRNPAIMMVEYDGTGTKVLRVFSPNISMNPHGMRVDRHGNIWAIDSFLKCHLEAEFQGRSNEDGGHTRRERPMERHQVERHVQPAAGHRLRQGRQFLRRAEPWRLLTACRLHVLCDL